MSTPRVNVPFIPDNAPFTADQRAWLNGFFAGLFSRSPTALVPERANGAPSATLIPLSILFGSQTGTAETLAKRVAKEAGRRGFAPTVIDMAQINLAALGSEKNVLVITSTYGEGDPPDNAKRLHAALQAAVSDAATVPPVLANLRFAIFALGDTNYTHFCKCGRDFDQLLEKLGGSPMLSWPSRMTRASGGASERSLRSASPVRARARSSSTWPSSTSAMITAAATK
jgi:sulfite reductase (NADPH) flavoprotein alpha-component